MIAKAEALNDLLEPDIRRTYNDVHKVVALGASLMDRGLQLLRSNTPCPARQHLAALRRDDWWVHVTRMLVDFAEAKSTAESDADKQAAGAYHRRTGWRWPEPKRSAAVCPRFASYFSFRAPATQSSRLCNSLPSLTPPSVIENSKSIGLWPMQVQNGNGIWVVDISPGAHQVAQRFAEVAVEDTLLMAYGKAGGASRACVACVGACAVGVRVLTRACALANE